MRTTVASDFGYPLSLIQHDLLFTHISALLFIWIGAQLLAEVQQRLSNRHLCRVASY